MFGELGQIPAVRRHLFGSRWTPIQRIKGHDDIFLAAGITEIELEPLLSSNAGKLKVRSGVPRFQSCHSFLQVKLFCLPLRPEVAMDHKRTILSWSNNLRQGSFKKTAVS